MKKILTILLFMFCAFTVSIAQTTSPKPATSVSKQDKVAIAAQKKADKQAKVLAKKQAKEANAASPVNSVSTAHLNKNGTPDKRFKAEKQATAALPAQTTSSTAATSVSKQDKVAMAAQKKADKQAKVLAKKQAKETNAASPVNNAPIAHLNKNGTPDKRFKTNNQSAVTPPAQARTETPAPVQTQATATPAKVRRQTPQVLQSNNVKTADKAIGTDTEGRTIYQGPRGGKYYINKNGHKEYVK